MAKKDMKKIELQYRLEISGNILAKLGRNEYISMQSVEKICGTPNCTIDEIMKFTESK
ncbi:helix-turn-helix transcriptional regulator [Frisingicoccus caecimuris]|uniref:helix-turn-helix domain-containing protein n=1 Tax=Frisingicoccus caecimuris TaxID=1796636 RepID=UPI00214AC1BB|nr:helix-turn-helix transcriptional regulator [Frisingicoccus caecimuris]MCR1918442.1 helix-turn-helix transcriptional regulator [Frisingicoccus caecimuris]